MPTPYSNIYKRFLSRIRDFDLKDLAELSPVDFENTLFKYLENAIPEFKYCKQNLDDRDDTLKQFNFDLTAQEENILAYIMLSEWISPYVNSQENIQQLLGSKDYIIYSPGNLLDKLSKRKLEIENKIADELVFYHYSNGGII